MLSNSTSTTESQPFDANVPVVSSAEDQTKQADTSSDVYGSCWTPRSHGSIGRLAVISCLLLGAGLIAFGFLNPNPPVGEEAGALLVWCIFGGIFLFIGLATWFATRSRSDYGVEATLSGINYVTSKKETKYQWNEIDKVLVSNFENSVFVCLSTTSNKQIVVGSGFQGDAEVVIDQILTHCDYIVRNPVAYSKNQK